MLEVGEQIAGVQAHLAVAQVFAVYLPGDGPQGQVFREAEFVDQALDLRGQGADFTIFGFSLHCFPLSRHVKDTDEDMGIYFGYAKSNPVICDISYPDLKVLLYFSR